jgi:hypothetical protein
MSTWLNEISDIDWLRDVHLPQLPANIRCAYLHGNEDAPTKIEAWYCTTPMRDALPDFVWEDRS